MERVDFSYEISDERLVAYGKIPLIDRLRWLDEVCRFTRMMRQGASTSANDRSQPSTKGTKGIGPST